jgi:hypothetical protein
MVVSLRRVFWLGDIRPVCHIHTVLQGRIEPEI